CPTSSSAWVAGSTPSSAPTGGQGDTSWSARSSGTSTSKSAPRVRHGSRSFKVSAIHVPSVNPHELAMPALLEQQRQAPDCRRRRPAELLRVLQELLRSPHARRRTPQAGPPHREAAAAGQRPPAELQGRPARHALNCAAT